ncbi:Surface antigen [Candidatus Burkholderia pumila]|uniref:Surface antigen n=1 Tax=Candidatus Burkholderia pumila TaxID=1090375 RepID=A0ABR5HLU1_9BURK|nr:Surface antigen [Candidatus Burkholderia pumila]
MKGIGLRIDKLKADPARDARQLAEMHPLAQNHQRALSQHGGVADARLAEYRWLLEELRISLFAQELRTPMPVLVKWLYKVWESMQRGVSEKPGISFVDSTNCAKQARRQRVGGGKRSTMMPAFRNHFFMRNLLSSGRVRTAFARAAVAAGAALVATAAFANNVIVLNSAEATLSLIDENTRQVVGTVPTGKEPHHLMPTPDASSLIVANSVSNNLMFVDPKIGAFQRWVQGIEDPYQIDFSPDRKWFVSTGLRLDRLDIYKYDGKNLTVAKRLPLATMPSHIAFTNDSATAFISLQVSGEIAAIDLATQTVKWKMKVGPVPAGVWLTPGDKYLLVGMTGADYVTVVDWRNQKIVKTIHTGKGAHNFRSLVDGKHVAVSNRVASTISIIDEDTLTNVGDIIGLLPGPDDMELSADKKYLWVTFRFAKHVGIIDLADRKLIQTIKVGRSPHGIYFYNRAPVTAPNGA